jgi:hypothetical protein
MLSEDKQMTSFARFFNIIVFGFLFVYSAESGGVSFGLYDISKSFTPIGWAVIIILPLAIIFGIIYSVAGILKKPKLK